MGTWDIKNFGNDEALDFVGGLNDEMSMQIEASLKKVAELSAIEYLEAPDCQAALAAAEVVAFLGGAPSDDFPKELENVTKSLKLHDSEALIAAAVMAINRIETSSELKELWEESPQYQDWVQVLEDLKNRLNR